MTRTIDCRLLIGNSTNPAYHQEPHKEGYRILAMTFTAESPNGHHSAEKNTRERQEYWVYGSESLYSACLLGHLVIKNKRLGWPFDLS